MIDKVFEQKGTRVQSKLTTSSAESTCHGQNAKPSAGIGASVGANLLPSRKESIGKFTFVTFTLTPWAHPFCLSAAVRISQFETGRPAGPRIWKSGVDSESYDDISFELNLKL